MSVPSRTVKIKLIRAVIVGGQDGAIGDVFEVSRYDAALLVGDGCAVLVEGTRTPPYSVTVENPEHGDPAPRRVSSAPEPREKVGAKKD